MLGFLWSLFCKVLDVVNRYTGADKGLAYIVTNHRWIIVVLFLMPATMLMNILFAIRNYINFRLGAMSDRSKQIHQDNVKVVKDALDQWAAEGKKTKLCSARPAWLAMSLRMGKYKKTFTGIPVQHLNHVVSMDLERRTVFVEPNVTMGQITATLNPLGWTLPVLPELDDLTVGGLVCGVGIETSSHRYGLFQHCCKSFEVVLPSGEVVMCSKDDHPDLFRAFPWSHGTLGFLVGVELDIVEAKRYVKLEYHPYTNKEEGVKASLAEYSGDDTADFVETLVYDENSMVLMLGRMVDEVPSGATYNPIGRWYKPWFYTHVRKFLQTGPATEYIPLRHYYHRHTISLFWEMQDIIPFGNDAWFRYLFGWLMPPNHSVLKRTQTEELRKLYEAHHVVQDMLVPASTLSKTLSVQHEKFGVYPLWVCPMRIFKEDSGFIKPAKSGEEMFIDLGIYGVPKVDFLAPRNIGEVEDYVRSVEGFQMLYADMYQSKDDFRKMFDHTLYDKMRKQYACEEAFPEVYDKTAKHARD
eukprot:m.353707 g.353707  ORF g.353707 m.353707 type:complete len:526 (+) comp16826_c0_seq1:209-1786(+)